MLKTERQSNFELLRLLAGMAVIVLHFNYFPGGGGALENATGLRYCVLTILEILSACAVNIFILISGYFNCCSKTVKTGRLVELLLQTILFSFAFRVVSCAVHHQWSIRALLASLLPANYFVVYYIILMILVPYINRTIESVELHEFTRLVIISFLFFSICATAVDVLQETTGRAWEGLSPIGLKGSMGGYTIVNFVLIYLVGAWLRIRKPLEHCKTGALVILLLLAVLIIFIWRRMLPNTAWTYCNPVLITESCLIFTLFKRLNIKSRRINALAPASFTCFLIHSHLLGFLVSRVSLSGPALQVFCLLLFSVIMIYGLSYIIMLIWNMIMRRFLAHLVCCLPTVSLEAESNINHP